MAVLVTTYQVLKSIHVLAAVVWVGGACMLQALAMLAVRSPNPADLVTFARNASVVGERIFVPASLILVVFGAWAVHEGGFDFSSTWIVLGLIVFAASFVVGAGFLGPEGKRIAKAVEAGGPESPEARMRIQRIFLVSRIELVFLLLIVVDMVVKPGT